MEATAAGFGFQGGRGVAFIGRARGLGVRAKRGAAARAAGSDSSLSPARSGEGDEPDGRGLHGGETGRGDGRWAGLGQEAGNGPAGKSFWAAR